MEDLQRAAVRVTPERERGDEWAVVLAATGIAHRLRRRPDGWALIVAPLDARAALGALDGYDREKQDERSDTVADGVTSVGGATVLGAAVALLLIGIAATTRVGWRRRGRRAARKPWVVVAACLALLALLGTSPDADILAHLFGLLVGGVLGLAAGFALPRAPRPSVQWTLALAAL